MTILSAIQTYIKTYGSLASNAPVLIDFLGSEPVHYSIVPLPGARIVESYIDGSSLREFPFAFQSMESAADDAERLANNEFYEAFADWLESQTEEGILPELGGNRTAERIEAVDAGFLFEQGESGTGVYQITCRLEYRQEPYEPDEGSPY